METTKRRPRIRPDLDRTEATVSLDLDRAGATVSLDLDRAGATASLVCAAHCAFMPVAITLLPLLGLGFLADSRMEWGLAATSAVLGVSSLCLGYRKHRRRRALTILALGLSALFAGRMVEEKHSDLLCVALVVAGGCGIAAAHLLNRALCHACRICRTAEDTPL